MEFDFACLHNPHELKLGAGFLKKEQSQSGRLCAEGGPEHFDLSKFPFKALKGYRSWNIISLVTLITNHQITPSLLTTDYSPLTTISSNVSKFRSVKKTHYFEDVYEVVRSIPKGRVSTYGAIADFLSLGSARMVGWALKQSGIMDGPIPAHRVVNREGYLSGRLGFPDPGYMQRALEREGVEIRNDRVVDFKALFWHPAENIL